MHANTEVADCDDSDLEGVSHPDVSDAITEDDTPIDLFSGKQMRLLTETLYTSWKPGVPFVAMANVALYVAMNRPPVVPDVLLTTEVSAPQDLMVKEHRSYFTWLYDGKPPEIVVEIVSNKKGGELDRKMREYLHIRVPWYVIFDPTAQIQEQPLVAYTLTENKYRPMAEAAFPLGLKLVLWQGEFEGNEETWLRWTDAAGKLLPTGGETAGSQTGKTEKARTLACSEKARAVRLAAKLRELGVNPDDVA